MKNKEFSEAADAVMDHAATLLKRLHSLHTEIMILEQDIIPQLLEEIRIILQVHYAAESKDSNSITHDNQ